MGRVLRLTPLLDTINEMNVELSKGTEREGEVVIQVPIRVSVGEDGMVTSTLSYRFMDTYNKFLKEMENNNE